MLEQKWIERMTSAFQSELMFYHSMPCVAYTKFGVQRKRVYPKIVETKLNMIEIPFCIEYMGYTDELKLDNNFRMESFTFQGSVNETNFFVCLKVNHRVKVWTFEENLFRTPNAQPLAKHLYPIMREFIEDYSPLRLHFLTEEYSNAGIPKELLDELEI